MVSQHKPQMQNSTQVKVSLKPMVAPFYKSKLH